MSEHLLPTLRIPETFTEVTTRQEHQGTTPVTVTRHHPGTDPKYGGEHVTTVFGDDCQAPGFVEAPFLGFLSSRGFNRGLVDPFRMDLERRAVVNR